MKRPLYVIAALACLSVPASADENAIESVIQRQLDAFLQDDFSTAFTYASPSIKSLFGTPERFGAMVRNSYPMVWRHAEVRFLDSETRDGRLWQNVMIRDAGEALHILEYQMVEGDDGKWKINAVRFREAPSGAV